MMSGKSQEIMDCDKKNEGNFKSNFHQMKYRTQNQDSTCNKRKPNFYKTKYGNKRLRYDQDERIFQPVELKCGNEYNLKKAIVYYEKIVQSLKEELNNGGPKDLCASNVLKESEGKEVQLSCRTSTSHRLVILLSECKDKSVMQRFMSAYADHKASVCTSHNASPITELLIYYALESIQNWATVLDSEDSEEKTDVSFYLNWLTEFGDFILQNFIYFIANGCSCRIVCLLISAFAGDLSQCAFFMSKNLKVHKNIEADSTKQEKKDAVLEQIPKSFAMALKKFYKFLLQSEILLHLVKEDSSATAIEALLFALKRRLPNCCKKMINKLAKALFTIRDQDNLPISLLHKKCTFMIDKMFKTATDDLQLTLWKQYIVDYLGKLIIYPVGDSVVQKMFDGINSKAVFETMYESIWCFFDDILMSDKFGIFVSIADACNRLSSKQASFVEHLMLSLQCKEPEDRQNLLLPLLVGFQKYESYDTFKDANQSNFRVCLRGVLVAQAMLKFDKPIEVVQSIMSMPPTDIEFLAGHKYGCHLLKTFFKSQSVGEENKEKLLHHLKPVMTYIACDREKSLTLSRIWDLLSLKLKEIVARELAENKDTLVKTRSGNAIFQKFEIHQVHQIETWRITQNPPMQ